MENLKEIKLCIDTYIMLNGYTRSSFARKHLIDVNTFKSIMKQGIECNVSEDVQKEIIAKILNDEDITIENLKKIREEFLEEQMVFTVNKFSDEKTIESRDPERIKPFLKRFEYLWSMYPDLRFGQLIDILSSRLGSDSFYSEDDEWIDVINREIEERRL